MTDHTITIKLGQHSRTFHKPRRSTLMKFGEAFTKHGRKLELLHTRLDVTQSDHIIAEMQIAFGKILHAYDPWFSPSRLHGIPLSEQHAAIFALYNFNKPESRN